eukprot:TRINITY_DN82988_c0_g1_i1.p1 TRINITY_DN82988_c0_g1~~TRINITY_DN82988_c0_g1_i1.p1  ORF type:complete len:222 (-),score=54.46 TRINITY_DN82988_c0_g1_i1:88-681(-)
MDGHSKKKVAKEEGFDFGSDSVKYESVTKASYGSDSLWTLKGRERHHHPGRSAESKDSSLAVDPNHGFYKREDTEKGREYRDFSSVLGRCGMESGKKGSKGSTLSIGDGKARFKTTMQTFEQVKEQQLHAKEDKMKFKNPPERVNPLTGDVLEPQFLGRVDGFHPDRSSRMCSGDRTAVQTGSFNILSGLPSDARRK